MHVYAFYFLGKNKSICRNNFLSFLCFPPTENVINCFALNPVIWLSSVDKSNYEWPLIMNANIDTILLKLISRLLKKSDHLMKCIVVRVIGTIDMCLGVIYQSYEAKKREQLCKSQSSTSSY